MFPYRRDFFRKLGLFLSSSLLPRPSRGVSRQQPQVPGGPSASQSSAPGEDLVRGHHDLIVVGGGIAGTCAAISAARNGMNVGLVHNRPMLGGNSSSEVRLFPENNSGSQPWIREGGIHDEFHTEERTRNQWEYRSGMMNCHWDLVLYEWAIREKNIRLYLNTHMHRVTMQNSSRIKSIYAIQLGTEKSFELSAPLFVDATGDGVLGYRARAEFRWGREARHEYGEPEAPLKADEKLMGNTLFFRAFDAGRPVPFKRPEWAAEFFTAADLTDRSCAFIKSGYWWIEVGAPYDPIKDNQEIQREALRQLLGVWDYIKNKGDHGAENYGLEFVGFWPYKRECRRLRGDFVITQQHIQDPKLLADAVAYGAWGIDIHVQGGILARDTPPYPPPRADENFERLGTMVYGIPLRALYSRNVHNLMMAGRPISCSYVAFASSRVLSTGAIVGQAVGAAASLCKKYRTTPRGVAGKHIEECQQLILRQDGHIPGVVNRDRHDLARQADITASSEYWLEFPESPEGRELTRPHAQLFPVSENRIDHVELLLESRRSDPVELRVGLRAAPRVWDFRSEEDLSAAVTEIPPNQTGWIRFPFAVQVAPEKLYWIYTAAEPGIFWKYFREIDGEPNRCPVGATAADLPGQSRWRPLTMGRSLCMRVFPQARPYPARNVNHGTNRPDMWTNIWISDPRRGLPAWLELKWSSPVSFNTVQITFDTDANRRVTLPLFRYPDCVKNYRVECRVRGSWGTLAEVYGNYMRRRLHHFTRVRTDRLRVFVTATNGADAARIYEVRVYDEA